MLFLAIIVTALFVAALGWRANAILKGKRCSDGTWFDELARKWAEFSRRTITERAMERDREAQRGAAPDVDEDAEWLDRQDYLALQSRSGFDECGRWARFDYVDRDGVVTSRSITNWERRGIYIVGYDRSKGAERTFRQDGIEDWVCG